MMVAKKAMTILVSASLVLGLCPLPRVAYATETIAEEGQADAPALLEDDVEPGTEEGISVEESADDQLVEEEADELVAEDVDSVEDVASPEEETIQSTDADDVVTAQTEEAATPKGKVAGSEPTVWLQSDASLPSKFDLRDRGVVTPVKNQLPWGCCWAHGAIAAAETSILTAMGSTYAETGLDLSERHLAWYVTNPVTEAISKSQAGEGLYVYDTDAGPNHVFDFGGREQCAATLFAQGIGPMLESDYPYRGVNGTLAYDYLAANKEAYIQERIAYYQRTSIYSWMSDDELRSYAEKDYNSEVKRYQKYDAYSPFDDWSITEPDEPGSGKLRGSAYTLTDNNVFNYWARFDDGELDAEEHFHKQPLYKTENHALWQDNIDQIKTELYEGRGVSVGVTISNEALNTNTWAAYDSQFSSAATHVVCIVGWDDDYDASNFIDTPPGNGAWIVKNSWGSETDAVKDGLIASDGTPKDAHTSEWGIVDENGKHTGYFYLSYYDGTINVPETFSFVVEPNNDQQDALQLDYLPASVAEFAHTDEHPTWEANIFTLEKDMRIDEVATRLRISNEAPLQGFTCTFNLYKLRDGATKPDDGTLLSTLTRTFQNQGYHRVALDAPIYLKAGDRLGIVVQQTYLADDGVTLYGTDAQECDGYRAIHKDPVYGEAVVNEGESFFNIEGVTSQEEGSQDGWLDVMAPFSKEMLLYLKPDVAGNSSILNYYVNRFCGKPIRDFFNIDNFGIKAFGEPVSLTHVDAVAPTCEEAGNVEYWMDDETGIAYADENGMKVLDDISDAALGHDWGKARYEWAKDCSSVTATCACKRDKSHVLTETVAPQGMSNATCTRAGKVVWTAEFEGEPFSTQVKMTDGAALGHDWGEATYKWSEDGKTCTAKRVCGNDDDHVQTETATATRKVTKEPTCTAAGSATLTATFQNAAFAKQTKTQSIKKLGHKWGKATYKWSKDRKTCTAKRVCGNDGNHKQTAKAKVTSKVTKKPTATKAGTRTYTAKFDVSWAKTQTKTEVIPATGMPIVNGKAYLQKTGWSSYIAGGKVVGTTGESRRLEALRLKLKNADVTGGIKYRAHVQDIGWEESWSSNGETCGTTGKGKRLEAVQIRLYGKMAKRYDVYYRVHAQDYGWMAWAKNGAKAGTAGQSKRVEAVQIVLVEKGAKAPSKTYKGVKQDYAKAYVEK